MPTKTLATTTPWTAALALLALFAPTPAAAADSARLARVDAYLRAFFEKSPVPGMSVVVVEGDQVVLARGYGVEQAGQPRSMTASSSVGIGSLGKSFTALAVMQLVEQGVVQLDDPLVKHVPWFRTADADASQRITLRMLLSNSSGLPSQDADLLNDVDTSDQALERGVRALQRYQLRRTPGESFEYSNEGWDALAVLLQEKTGQPYGQLIDQRILQPLGMNRSTARIDRLPALTALDGHWPAIDGVHPALPIY